MVLVLEIGISTVFLRCMYKHRIVLVMNCIMTDKNITRQANIVFTQWILLGTYRKNIV